MSWSRKIIEDLQAGKQVQTRLHGNSMTPLIESGAMVTIVPAKVEDMQVGDVAYCKVKGNVYAHLVKGLGVRGCLIGNNHGHINGWTRNVYGKVTAVEK